ncbi:tape measure protein [Arthrobacter sp. GMC3]|uniref:tape measure protein n=1 Tax=Arthrobacter sp. GMC3 TaxID=2058894 RepID=UPI000CE4894A|nr:tape measure protein [Arthrobacter sp. GMC3]
MSKSAVLSVRIVADGKDAERGLNDVAKATGNLEGSLKTTSSPLSKVTSLIGGVAKVAAGAVGVVGGLALTVATLAVKGGIERALAIEGAQAKLKGLGHDTASVTAVMDSALASVKGTAYGLGDAAKVAANVVAAGVKPGQDLTRTLKIVADTATIAGTGMDEMGSIFNKVAAGGKVTTEVINQLQDRGVPAFDLLAKSMGKTVPEIQALVTKGKIGFAEFQDAMEKGMGGAALKTGDTTVGAFNNMKAALSRFGLILAGGFFPLFKDVFNQITLILDGLGERLKPVGDAFAVTFQAKAGPIIADFAKNTLAFFDEIIGGFRAFAAAWKANDGDVTSSGFPGFMERVANAARVVQGVFAMLDFSSFDAFIASLGTAGGAAGTSLGSIGSSVQALVPAFQAFMEQLPNITGALVKLGGLSLNVLTAGLSFLADHVDTIIQFMPLIVAGFVAWKVASSAAAVAGERINAMQVLAVPLTTANNVLRLVAIRQENQLAVATGARTVAMQTSLASMAREKVAMVASGVAMVAQKVALGVATAAQWAFNAAMSANPVMLVVLAIAALVAGVILAYNNIGWFKDFVDGAFKFIGEVIANVVNWAKDNWGLLLSILIGPFGLLIQWLVENWSTVTAVFTVAFGIVMDVVGNVVTFFKDAWNLAVLIVTAYIQGWLQVISNVTIAIRFVVNAVVNFFTDAWRNTINFVVGFIIGFQNTVAGIFGTVRGTIDNVVGFVRDGLSGAFQTAARLATGAMDTITGAIRGVIGWVKDAINWVGSLFGATNNARSNASGLGGATTSYLRGPTGGPDFPGGATGFMLRPAAFAPSGGAASPTVVNIDLTVNGAIDGDGTAKTILKLLKEELRRNGVVLNGAELW